MEDFPFVLYWNSTFGSESRHSSSKFASLMIYVPARIASFNFRLAIAERLAPTASMLEIMDRIRFGATDFTEDGEHDRVRLRQL
jgi:hypothetical protein